MRRSLRNAALGREQLEPRCVLSTTPITILPIGDNFTMGVDSAILASDFVECDKVLGCHYDTFGYIEIDHEEAKRKFFDRGKDLMLLDIGESIEL